MTGDVIARSLVVPVYGNEANIPALLDGLAELDARIDGLEVVLVVDGSPDRSWDLLAEALPQAGLEAQLVAHSRNFGAFPAVRTGLGLSRGHAVAVMAADQQEPVDLIVEFFDCLDRGDVDVVFGHRQDRSDPLVTRLTSAFYWRLYRRFVVPDVPNGGVDVFACTAQVRDAVLELGESNSSLVAQLFWVGFRRDFVPYRRRARQDGTSAWTARRRLRYMADSLFAFSDLPILVLLWTGIVGLVVSGSVALATLVGRLAGAIDTPGYATVVILVSLLFSMLITTQGIIGMYLWRAFENTKQKPTGIVMSVETYNAGGEVGR